MASEWKQVTFADVIEIISGGTPKTSVPGYWGGSIPWLAVSDFNTGYRWVDTAEKMITDQGLAESATTILNRGDIIISARGTVGVVAQLSKPMAFNQSCYGIRGRQGISETTFVYYALRHAVSQMQQVAHGGVFSTITRDTFKIIEMLLPPLSEQKAIAHILGTLDDKIELNRKMNETLEAMARAIFKAWFVDFEPVRAKMEGSWQRGQSLPGLPAHLYDLFPDRLVDSELGEIPEGWNICPFTETVEIIDGGTPKTSIADYWDGGIPWFSVVDAPLLSDVWVMNTEKEITEEGLKNSSTKVLPVGTTIISARGTVGRIALVGKPMAMNQSCYGLRGKYGTLGIFNYFATRELIVTLQQHAHGCVFDTITRDTLAGVTVAVPPDHLVEVFEASVGPFLQQIRTILLESHTLSTLRDRLLPKLISGDQRIMDAEKIVEKTI